MNYSTCLQICNKTRNLIEKCEVLDLIVVENYVKLITFTVVVTNIVTATV